MRPVHFATSDPADPAASFDASLEPAFLLRTILPQPPMFCTPEDAAAGPLLAPQRMAEASALLLCDFDQAVAAVADPDGPLPTIAGRLCAAFDFPVPSLAQALGNLAGELGFHPRLAERAWRSGQGFVLAALVVRVSLAREIEVAIRRRWLRQQPDGRCEREGYARTCRLLVQLSDTHLEMASWMRSTCMYADAALRLPGVLTLISPHLAEHLDVMGTFGYERSLMAETTIYRNIATRKLQNVSAYELFYPDACRGWDADRLPDLTGLLPMGSLWNERQCDNSLLGAMVHTFATKPLNHACLKRNFVKIVVKQSRTFPVLMSILRDVVCTSLLGLYDYRLHGVMPLFRDRVTIVENWSMQTVGADSFCHWVERNGTALMYALREYYCYMLDALTPLRCLVDREMSVEKFSACIHCACDTMRIGQSGALMLAYDMERRAHAPAQIMSLSDRSVLLQGAAATKPPAKNVLRDYQPYLDQLDAPFDVDEYLEWRSGLWRYLYLTAGKRSARPGMLPSEQDSMIRELLGKRQKISTTRQLACAKKLVEHIDACQLLHGSRRMHDVKDIGDAMQRLLLRNTFKLRKGTFSEIVLASLDLLFRKHHVDHSLRTRQTALLRIQSDPALVPDNWRAAAATPAQFADLVDRCAQVAATESTDWRQPLPVPDHPAACRLPLRWLRWLGVSEETSAAMRTMQYRYEVEGLGDTAVTKGVKAIRRANEREFILLAAFFECVVAHMQPAQFRLPAAAIRQQLAALRWRTMTPWWEPLPPGGPTSLYCTRCNRWASDCIDARGAHRVWAGDNVGSTPRAEDIAKGMHWHGDRYVMWDSHTGMLTCSRSRPHTVFVIDPQSGRVAARYSTSRRTQPDKIDAVFNQFITAPDSHYTWEDDVWPALVRYLAFDDTEQSIAAEAAFAIRTARAEFDRATRGNPTPEQRTNWAQTEANIKAHRDGMLRKVQDDVEAYKVRAFDRFKKAVASARSKDEASRCVSTPLLKVNMIGKVVRLGGVYWAMCTRCATIARFCPQNMTALGFTCGCHVHARLLAPPPSLTKGVSRNDVAPDEPMALVGSDPLGMPALRIHPDDTYHVSIVDPVVLHNASNDDDSQRPLPEKWKESMLAFDDVEVDVRRVQKTLAREYQELEQARIAAGLPGPLAAYRAIDCPVGHVGGGMALCCEVCAAPAYSRRREHQLWRVPAVDDSGGRTEGRDPDSACYSTISLDDPRLTTVRLCHKDMRHAENIFSMGYVYSKQFVLDTIANRSVRHAIR